MPLNVFKTILSLIFFPKTFVIVVFVSFRIIFTLDFINQTYFLTPSIGILNQKIKTVY